MSHAFPNLECSFFFFACLGIELWKSKILLPKTRLPVFPSGAERCQSDHVLETDLCAARNRVLHRLPVTGRTGGDDKTQSREPGPLLSASPLTGSLDSPWMDAFYLSLL